MLDAVHDIDSADEPTDRPTDRATMPSSLQNFAGSETKFANGRISSEAIVSAILRVVASNI